MGDTVINDRFYMRPIKEFENFNFFIDDYQRGYKWSYIQVLELLIDVRDFNVEEQPIYSLQPAIVKLKEKENEEEKNIYEVVDGQQRITTIYIILQALENSIYSIDYATREESSKFLSKIETLEVIDYPQVPLIDKMYQAKLNEGWTSYVSNHSEFDNVDNYHFYCAYQTIKLWFNYESIDKKDFKDRLLNRASFIWYEVETNESSKSVFRDYNSSKIKLTNAELIKALFIIDKKNPNKTIQDLKQNQIATEWDRIEYELQNEEFWYFINGDPKNSKYTTRIDYLFELIKGSPKDAKDIYYTYKEYDKDLKNNNLNWNEVKLLHQKFMEWFENQTTYHLIGFIITRNFEKINTIIELSNSCAKSEFIEEVRKIIIKKFKKTSIDKVDQSVVWPYDLDKINYKDNYQEVISILQLFNIETCEKTSYRFPFYRLKDEIWSLEHIHAQNSKNFNFVVEVIDWTNDIVDFVTTDKSIKETTKELIIKTIEDFKLPENPNQDEKIEKELRNKMELLEAILEEKLKTHFLSNMALLDKRTNSKLGNKNFSNKREKIIELDKNGFQEKSKKVDVYIPLCTINVFMKYYSSGELQFTYWGMKDREDYLKSIKKLLSNYFPQKPEYANEN